MNDGDYPQDPSSSDPQKRLARDARRRIVRAIVNADKFIWDAEASIQARHLDDSGMSAQIERSSAAFQKARAILTVVQAEYSQVVRHDKEYRDWLDDEIEGLGNSLQLTRAQRYSLRSEFFFPIGGPHDATEALPTESEKAIPSGDSPQDCKATRRSRVDAFLKQCNKISEKRIYKNHIWKSVGHKTARQFEYWQECSDKSTAEDQRNFSRVLGRSSQDFLATLKKQKLVSE